MLNLVEKHLKALRTRANLRRFLDYVSNGQVEKITKMCLKGLDPNFHCQETGETPLTLATGIKKSCKVLIALVNGGALLDYRTRDGSTAMHRAVERNNLEAVTHFWNWVHLQTTRMPKGLHPCILLLPVEQTLFYVKVCFMTEQLLVPRICKADRKCISFKLNVWDVGGQKSLRSYWRNYFESTDGLIWVVDSADKRRLEDCKKELHTLMEEERLAGATLLVFANKQDLPGALSAEEIKQVLELDAIKTHHWQIVCCSAVTGQNLLQGIDWLIDDIAARIFTLD